MTSRVLVTGATGFIGAALLKRLIAEQHFDVRVAVRHEWHECSERVERVVVGELAPTTDWHDSLAGAMFVVHLAGRVHIMREKVADPVSEFRRVNALGTINLARQAARAGVKRLVFLSSVKVNGERGVYSESAPTAPLDPYAISKSEAELGLRWVGKETGMDVVIIRSPLVYGPGVKANFQALMRAVGRGIPLPLGAIHNKRSFVGLDNLVDFILTCIEHPAAANETFMVSDGEDLSTSELVRRLARVMDRPARLIPVPTHVLMAGAIMLGKRDLAQRLLTSLQVDISKARELLGWLPPISVDEGLRRAAAFL